MNLIELSIKIQMPSGVHAEDKDYFAMRLKDTLQHDITQTIAGFAPAGQSAIVDVNLVSKHQSYASAIHPHS